MILNEFTVHPEIERLMSRADWQRKRTDDAWLNRFPPHPHSGYKRLPFIEFCGEEWARFENANLRDPRGVTLCGSPNLEYPPGDFDPTAGYLIGFTDQVDAGIFVDLRPAQGPRIIYDGWGPGMIKATAFNSIPEFVQFYLEQHGT